MGWFRNHVIVVQGDPDLVQAAHAEAARIFPQVSEVITDRHNFKLSFFVPPDGSKEGWAESDHGDTNRREFVAWLRRQVHDDGTAKLQWAEVEFGCSERDFDRGDRVLRGSSEDNLRLCANLDDPRVGALVGYDAGRWFANNQQYEAYYKNGSWRVVAPDPNGDEVEYVATYRQGEDMFRFELVNPAEDF